MQNEDSWCEDADNWEEYVFKNIFETGKSMF